MRCRDGAYGYEIHSYLVGQREITQLADQPARQLRPRHRGLARPTATPGLELI